MNSEYRSDRTVGGRGDGGVDCTSSSTRTERVVNKPINLKFKFISQNEDDF